MGISATLARSKIYSNSPRPLVWMGYGLVFQIASFHKLKLDGYGLGKLGMCSCFVATMVAGRESLSDGLHGSAGPVATLFG